MRFTAPDGSTVYVPGVYSLLKVVANLPGPVPEFQIPIIIGAADEARYPADFAATKQDVEDPHIPFLGLGTSSAVKTAFGPDSDLARATVYAKRHGLPFAFFVAINGLTRASVLVTSSGPTTQGTLFSKKYGAIGGHIKVQVVGGNDLAITPIKRYSMTTRNASSGATRLYVKDSSWLIAGDTITVGDNNSANADYTVDSVGTELDTVGQVAHYIELTSALAADITTAQYGVVLQYDDDKVEEPATFGSLQEMIDWLNQESDYLGFQKGGSYTGAGIVPLASATPLKEIAAWSTVTAGTTPAATSGDHSDFITLLDASAWDEFAINQQVIPQAFLILEQDSDFHVLYRDWATSKRDMGEAISVTAGCAWGDTDMSASDDTNPAVRAAALNSQDFMLAAGGLDKVAAYLSLAPAIFGRRIEGGIGHNLTNDELIYTEVEKMWNERGSGELTTLHKKGVATYRLSTSRGVQMRISQGLSTLQGAASSWDEVTAKTPLVMQRDLADFCDRVLRDDLDGTQIGGDEVDPSTIAAVVVRRAQKTLLKRSYISEFKITNIELADNGAGYNVDWSIRLRTTNDYIGLTTSILIGEE